MVLAAVADRLLVAQRVVPLGVDHIDQRGDLGETLRQVIEQRRYAVPVLLAEDHDHHHLAGRGRADDHIAHQAAVLAGIIESIAVLDAEPFGLQPDGVRRVALQMAGVDVQHLVEHVGDVETQRRLGCDLAPGVGDLLVGHPAPVGEGELQLVAVVARVGRAQAGADFGQFDLADPGQLVADLLGLEAQLLGVGQILPLAAAADPEMGAERLLAQRRALAVVDDESLHEAAALDPNLHVDHVAGHGHRYEDHLFVPTPHRLALGGERRDFEPLDQGVVLFLASHSFLFIGTKIGKIRHPNHCRRKFRSISASVL